MNSAVLWRKARYSLYNPDSRQFHGRNAVRIHKWRHFVDGPPSAKARMVPCREEDWLTAGPCTYTEIIVNYMCSKNEHIDHTGASDAYLPKSTAHIIIVILSICAECTPHSRPKPWEHNRSSLCGWSSFLAGTFRDSILYSSD